MSKLSNAEVGAGITLSDPVKQRTNLQITRLTSSSNVLPPNDHAESAEDRVCGVKKDADAAEAAAWANLRKRFLAWKASHDEFVHLEKVLDVVGSRSTDLPRSVLDVAPHLAETPCSDPIIKKTWDILSTFSGEEIVNKVVFIVAKKQCSHQDSDPLDSSVLRKIVLDQYVDFEQIHANLGMTFTLYDSMEVAIGEGEFTIVTHNQIRNKKPVSTESQWALCFDAWSTGVVHVYQHRCAELSTYRQFIMDLFRQFPSKPHIPIDVDRSVRSKYALCKFRMDDEDRCTRISIAHIHAQDRFNHRDSPVPSHSRSNRAEKRSDVICFNWNLDRCQDPCPGGRKHGVCSECHDDHPAISASSCKASFRARKRKGRNTGV